MLGVSKRTLNNWVSSGKVPQPPVNPLNKYRKWTLKDVNDIRNILQEEM